MHIHHSYFFLPCLAILYTFLAQSVDQRLLVLPCEKQSLGQDTIAQAAKKENVDKQNTSPAQML